MKGKVDPDRYKDWRKTLADGVAAKLKSPGANKYVEDGDIHPLRLCEEINNSARDAVLVVTAMILISAGNPCRLTRRAIASSGRSAPWAWACRSRSAPSSPSPMRR